MRQILLQNATAILLQNATIYTKFSILRENWHQYDKDPALRSENVCNESRM